METIAISKFKATCLAVLERVRVTGEPVLVTRFGKAVAEVSPPRGAKMGKRSLGDLAGTAKILGDLIAPAAPAELWEALSEPKAKRKRR
jgi:antitoxin (DNA-binding transcriptional repressor) of toxin-antitoxin stability system